VILVLTDDQGYGDLGCHGNTMIRTPNIDRFHSQSVRFTNFHVDPLCSPTRSALMTGRYSARTGVWATVLGRSLLRRDEVTAGDVFGANGYRTGIFGKWHLGDNYPFRPQDRGFQEVLVHGGCGVGQAPDYWGNSYFNDTYFHNGKPQKFQGYCADVFFGGALRFIEANRDRPFFCYLPTNAPHGPLNVDEKYSRPYLERGVPEAMAKFYGMIENIDQNMGRLLRRLSELRLENDTLVIFMTDNGTASGVARGGEGSWQGFNAGMRGQKGMAYEGGHRVPCFLRWPAGGIGGARDINRLSAHIDLLPTLIELAGLERPPGPAFDGRSLVPLIRGERGFPERSLIVQTQQRDIPEMWKRSAVMTQRWRLVDGKELYDMDSDPAESRDTAARNPAVVAQLRSVYERWWADISKRFNEYSEIVLGADRENPTRLSSMDWHGAAIPPWNQQMIKQAPKVNGWWAVQVERDGKYEFTLRQQPREANFPIQAETARLQAGPVTAQKAVPPGTTGVTFPVTLPRGSARLETWFEEKGGSRGAYYVDVLRN
jgi:arylsulfatase A-like enzyme